MRRWAAWLAGVVLTLCAAPVHAQASFRLDLAVRDGDVVYVPAVEVAGSSISGSVRRYDLASGSWLAPWPFPLVGNVEPAAIAVDEGRVFVAVTGAVLRVDAGVPAPTPVVFVDQVTGLAAAGGRLFVANWNTLSVYDESGAGPISSRDFGYWTGLAVAPQSARLYGRHPFHVVSIGISPSGALVGDPLSADLDANADFRLSPDEESVVGLRGDVLDAATLTWRSHVEGPYRDVTFDGATTIALDNAELRRFDADQIEAGRTWVEQSFEPRRIFVRDGAIHLLRIAGYELEWTTVPLAALQPIASTSSPPLLSSGASFTLDPVMDESGVVYVATSAAVAVPRYIHLFRYSATERRFLPSIPLGDPPSAVAICPGQGRIVLAFSFSGGSTLRTVDLDGGPPALHHLAFLPWSAGALACANDRIVASDGQDYVRVFESGGGSWDGNRGLAHPLLWNAATQRLYSAFAGRVYSRELLAGTLGEPTYAAIQANPAYPLALSPDGQLLLDSVGRELDAETLAGVRTFGAFPALVWNAVGIYALRTIHFPDIEIVKLGPDLAVLAAARLASSDGFAEPTALAASSARVAVVRVSESHLAFDFYPEDDADGDGVFDRADAFPHDPTDWQDVDGDGHGDNADAFPNDPLEWGDFDGDGIGDHSDPFPIGNPEVAIVGLQGTDRLFFRGLGSLHRSIGGNFGLLPNGAFSLCDEGGCVFGYVSSSSSDGRTYQLAFEPDFLPAIETSIAEGAGQALSSAFGRQVDLELAAEPETLRLTLKLNRSRTQARLHMHLLFRASLSNVPRRFRKMKVDWSWAFEKADVQVASP